MKEDEMLYQENDAAVMLGVSPHTLSYYRREGLIFPCIENRQIRYSSTDIAGAGKVILLKNSGMSINEIKTFLRSPPAKQKTQALSHSEKIGRLIKKIKKHVGELNLEDASPAETSGIPFNCLQLLHCPICGADCGISGAEIYNGKITQGSIKCRNGDCNSPAYKIIDGLFILKLYIPTPARLEQQKSPERFVGRFTDKLVFAVTHAVQDVLKELKRITGNTDSPLRIFNMMSETSIYHESLYELLPESSINIFRSADHADYAELIPAELNFQSRIDSLHFIGSGILRFRRLR